MVPASTPAAARFRPVITDLGSPGPNLTNGAGSASGSPKRTHAARRRSCAAPPASTISCRKAEGPASTGWLTSLPFAPASAGVPAPLASVDPEVDKDRVPHVVHDQPDLPVRRQRAEFHALRAADA